MNNHVEVAETIRRQIKMLDRWAFGAWAATNFMAINSGYMLSDKKGATEIIEKDLPGLSFKLGKNPKIKTGGHVRIYLNGNDLYDIVILKIRGLEIKKLYEINDIYAENLVEILNEQIG